MSSLFYPDTKPSLLKPFKSCIYLFVYETWGGFCAFESCMRMFLASFFKNRLEFFTSREDTPCLVYIWCCFQWKFLKCLNNFSIVQCYLFYFFDQNIISLSSAHCCYEYNVMLLWCKQGFYNWTDWKGKNGFKKSHSCHLC